MTDYVMLSPSAAILWVDQLQEIVSWWRNEIKKIDPEFCTPDERNSMRFAATEAAEIIDADMRNGGAWSRNASREMHITDEVGDLLFMLISALNASGGGMPLLTTLYSSTDPTVDELAAFTFAAYNHIVMGWNAQYPHPLAVAIHAVLQYCVVKTIDPIDLVESRLSRILAKRKERLNGSVSGRSFAPREEWG